TGRPIESMTKEEALEILGLEPGATREEIIDAHRKLMSRVHPDKGGSDYLAQSINQARKILLDDH
ncbi:MAG: DnaJ domain-containing protein, partial [Gammaproteobacteria bacterium]|nr:DnaJ domain-containing protein [Gammaproteobacteria bacterium]